MAWLCKRLGHGAFTFAACLTKSGRARVPVVSVSQRSFANAAPEPREAMEYDVCIVGAGPAGLSAAIKLKQVWLLVFENLLLPRISLLTNLMHAQQCQAKDKDLSVCVVEKGAEVGELMFVHDNTTVCNVDMLGITLKPPLAIRTACGTAAVHLTPVLLSRVCLCIRP